MRFSAGKAHRTVASVTNICIILHNWKSKERKEGAWHSMTRSIRMSAQAALSLLPAVSTSARLRLERGCSLAIKWLSEEMGATNALVRL